MHGFSLLLPRLLNVFPPDYEPVTMSIQLEYVGGLTLDLTLSLGQPYIVRSYIGERVIR